MSQRDKEKKDKDKENISAENLPQQISYIINSSSFLVSLQRLAAKTDKKLLSHVTRNNSKFTILKLFSILTLKVSHVTRRYCHCFTVIHFNKSFFNLLRNSSLSQMYITKIYFHMSQKRYHSRCLKCHQNVL